jgi:hypothetical protein
MQALALIEDRNDDRNVGARLSRHRSFIVRA